jgi:hypothetical protein
MVQRIPRYRSELGGNTAPAWEEPFCNRDVPNIKRKFSQKKANGTSHVGGGVTKFPRVDFIKVGRMA